jgi:hypothetical protein
MFHQSCPRDSRQERNRESPPPPNLASPDTSQSIHLFRRVALADNGYTEYRKEGIVVAGWPVQFLPVASPLDAEALEHSVPTEITINSQEGSVNAPILTAEHVMATALSVGRPKDFIRLSQFIEAGAFDSGALCGILNRHGIRDKWTAFCARFEIYDPCMDGHTP